MSDPILNLSAWIERRSKQVGPLARHIVHSVTAYETHITAQAAEIAELQETVGFYGDKRNWEDAALVRVNGKNGTRPLQLINSTIDDDGGAIARAALSKEGE